MRTTFRLDEHLLQDAKKLAAESGRSLTAVVEEALREMLARRKQNKKKRRPKIPTVGTGGLQPGVDLDNSAALLEIMDADLYEKYKAESKNAAN